jgi:hypothetical protein
MELMSWFIKPFNKSMIWLGEAVDRYTIFGIKVFWIILYVGVLFTTITLADAIYDKGYRAGMETINEK